MTPQDFRQLALQLPAASEGQHMGHADFRVADKIFATLGPDETWAMVKLTLEQQSEWIREKPRVFEPIPGGWGRRGATKIHLIRATEKSVVSALWMAWRNTAPQKLLHQLDQL